MGKLKVYADNRLDLQREVKKFNSNPTLENYKILESYIDPIERSYCRDCGGSIYYKGRSKIQVKFGTNIMKYNANQTTCKTFKEANGKDFYLSVCEDCLIKKFPEYLKMNPSRSFNSLNDTCAYAFNIPDVDRKIKTKELAISKESRIAKYGEEEGEKIWDAYREVQGETNTFEYKRDNYGWTREQFDEFNQSRAVTVEILVRRHGEEKGHQIFDDYVEKQRTHGNSLEWFINKHGKEKGEKIFKEMLSAKTCYPNGLSLVSQEFFSILDDLLNNKYITYYGNKNGEYIFITKDRGYALDFFVKDLNVCVEFFGDYFHANPIKYLDPKRIMGFKNAKTVSDVWERDNKRIKELEENGIKTIIVWENDYYKNKNNPEFYKEIVNKIIINGK